MEAITAFGEFARKVLEVDFDPSKTQNKEFVRVRVSFDVSKPLRRSKVVNLPHGEVISILYDYERIQKRCFTCQRLTHEQDNCPLFIRKKQEIEDKRTHYQDQGKISLSPLFKASDPLIGVLPENQVGVDQITRKQKISLEAVDGMRQFLLLSTDTDRQAKEDKIKFTIGELEKIGDDQISFSSYEPKRFQNSSIDKGKGIQTDLEMKSNQKEEEMNSKDQKLLLASIQAGVSTSSHMLLDEVDLNYTTSSLTSAQVSTDYGAGVLDAGSSGSKLHKAYQRRKPYKPRKSNSPQKLLELDKGLDKGKGLAYKRKGTNSSGRLTKSPRLSKTQTVPNEGLSNI